jgi:hypothetical protein
MTARYNCPSTRPYRECLIQRRMNAKGSSRRRYIQNPQRQPKPALETCLVLLVMIDQLSPALACNLEAIKA